MHRRACRWQMRANRGQRQCARAYAKNAQAEQESTHARTSDNKLHSRPLCPTPCIVRLPPAQQSGASSHPHIAGTATTHGMKCHGGAARPRAAGVQQLWAQGRSKQGSRCVPSNYGHRNAATMGPGVGLLWTRMCGRHLPQPSWCTVTGGLRAPARACVP